MGTPSTLTKCKVCGKSFLTWPYRLKEGAISCSKSCGNVSHSSNSKGSKWQPEARKRLSVSKTTNSTNYSTIHKWLKRTKGMPKYCENCNLTDPTKRYEWSNTSGVYNRDPNNYERLCVPCHRRKDGHDKLYLFSSVYKKSKAAL